jgi:hypothetical protein
MFKDLIKNLKLKLKKKNNDDLDSEELFDEDEAEINGDDEKTIEHNLDEFQKANMESESIGAAESDSFQPEESNTETDSFNNGDTGSFGDNEFEELIDDDEFDSHSPDLKSKVIRSVVALIIVYVAVDEFILTDKSNSQHGEEVQKRARKQNRLAQDNIKKKKKNIPPPRMKQVVAETVAKQVEVKTEALAKQVEVKTETVAKQVEVKTETIAKQVEAKTETVAKQVEVKTEAVAKQVEVKTEALAKQVEVKTETVAKQVEVKTDNGTKELDNNSTSNKDKIAKSDTESNIKSETLNVEMNEGKEAAATDKILQQEEEEEPEAFIGKSDVKADVKDSISEESKNISQTTDQATKKQSEETLEESQTKVSALEMKNSRAPASMTSSENIISKRDFKIMNLDKKRSKDAFVYIKSMIPIPADVKKYDFIEAPKFKDSDYGRGLVYNCKKQHWACVSKQSYFKCRDHARWSLANSKSPKCVINSIHKSLKSCSVSQLISIEQLAVADFCNYESEREPATSVEVGEESISYEEGL